MTYDLVCTDNERRAILKNGALILTTTTFGAFLVAIHIGIWRSTLNQVNEWLPNTRSPFGRYKFSIGSFGARVCLARFV